VRSGCFPTWPYFSDDEIAAVMDVMGSGSVNYWTGEQGRLFEEEFARCCGCKHAVAVANGTLALELALRALGIGLGDEVITSSRTFIASAEPEKLQEGWSRNRIISAIESEGVPCYVGSCREVYLEKAVEPIRPATRR